MTIKIYDSYRDMIKGIFSVHLEKPKSETIVKCRAVYDKNGRLKEVIPTQIKYRVVYDENGKVKETIPIKEE